MAADPNEPFRASEQAHESLDLVIIQRSKLAAVQRSIAQEKCPCNNVIDSATTVIQCPIQRHSQQLCFIVADQSNRLLKRINCLDRSSDNGLHLCERWGHFFFIGNAHWLYN